MRKVLIVKNKTHEGPGLFERLLRDDKIPYQIIDLDNGDPLPSLESCSAAVVLGGPDSANDATEKMREQLEWIREILSRKIPYLGVCLGLQTLVKAKGGKVIKSSVKEIGFRDPEENLFEVLLTEEGKKDPLLANCDGQFPVFHLHGETVQLSKGMTLLGKGKFCENQLVRVGENAYGMQFHLELTPEMFEVWLREDSDLKQRDRASLQKDFQSLQDSFSNTAQTLFLNFLQIASLLPNKSSVR